MLQWKEFNVDLQTVMQEIKAVAPSAIGLSTPMNVLRVDGNLTQEDMESIQEYWNGLTNQSEAAVRYLSQVDFSAAIEASKLDAVTKTYDQLSVAQKKLMMGLTPTREELGV